jgi:hypothetical protein
MISVDRKPFPAQAVPGLCAIALLAIGLAPARAEDPLLGRIKTIQCVGCTPGSVDLVVHDPIDVRDFSVRINEADYQKIITPLAGKTVYDKEGCFYWMEPLKEAKSPAGAAKEKETAKNSKVAKKPAKADTAVTEGVLATSAPAPMPEVQGTPSRCIPFTKVEPKPAHPGKKDD